MYGDTLSQMVLIENAVNELDLEWYKKHFHGTTDFYDVIRRLQSNRQDKSGFSFWLMRTFKKSGKVKQWWPSERTRESRTYVDGKLHGTTVVYSLQGKIEDRLDYENGDLKYLGLYHWMEPSDQEKEMYKKIR